MPDKIFLHHHPGFVDVIDFLVRELDILPALVEKDYWIMHCLFGLQQAGYEFRLKGGTSLSKGYILIHRFSEDIDIYIVPPDNFDLKTGRNHDKPNHIEGRKGFFDWLATNIVIEGIQANREPEFDDKKYRNGGILLTYQPHFDIDATGAKRGGL